MKTDLTSKPLAMPGLISYRCKGLFNWIMIGATDDEDAFKQALRSSTHAKRETLQVWNGNEYVPCEDGTPAEEAATTPPSRQRS